MALVCTVHRSKQCFSMCKTCKIRVRVRINMMPIHITKIQPNKLVTGISLSLLINNDGPILQCHVKEFP